MPRLYPIRFRVGYSLVDGGIFLDILYMITMNYKFYIEKFSGTIYYLSGGLDRNPTFLTARLSYVLYINLLMARA